MLYHISVGLTPCHVSWWGHCTSAFDRAWEPITLFMRRELLSIKHLTAFASKTYQLLDPDCSLLRPDPSFYLLLFFSKCANETIPYSSPNHAVYQRMFCCHKQTWIYKHPLAPAEVDLWHLVAMGLWLFAMKGFCVKAPIS